MTGKQIVQVVGLCLMFGLVTLLSAAFLAVVGFPINPYLTWWSLWMICNLAFVWKVARR